MNLSRVDMPGVAVEHGYQGQEKTEGYLELRGQSSDEQEALDALIGRELRAERISETTVRIYALPVFEPECSDGPDYSAMTVAELKTLAAEREVHLGGATKKDDIIAVLQADDAEPTDAPGADGDQDEPDEGGDGED